MKKLFILLISIIFVFQFESLAQSGWVYQSPVAGSKYINPEQSIILRSQVSIDAGSLNADLLDILGSKSGLISCSVKLANDGKTVIFKPEKPMAFGETISVSLRNGLTTKNGIKLESTAFTFQIQPRENLSLLSEYYLSQESDEAPFIKEQPMTSAPLKKAAELITYGDYSLPERYMEPIVTVLDDPFPGYNFGNPRPRGTVPYDPYNVILDKYGVPVFFQEWNKVCNLLQKTLDDKVMFCSFSNANPTVNRFYVMDNHFNFIDTLVMGNGYHIDQHGIHMMENGNHFLIAYDPQPVGMDTVFPGGNPNATVVGLIIQELDSDHNVLFQWRSWDHFDILDGTHMDFTAAMIDYAHGNSISLTPDNQLIVSCRGMDEVTKINRTTGDIIWRFGLHAKNNMFTFTNDTVGFYKQHDAIQLANGNVTVYDNGVWHPTKFSQGVEYVMDEVNYTATLVWSYQHDPSIYADATGSFKKLDNDNRIICWGLHWPTAYTEVNTEGEVVWELNFPDSIWNYQVFRQDWETDLFTTAFDTVDYGYYNDYIPWPVIIPVTNNSNEAITINSASNHNAVFTLTTSLPLTIEANQTANMIVSFYPDGVGQQNFEDVLTLNVDSYFSDTLSRRIARQVILKGTTINPVSTELLENQELKIYPNPTQNTIEIASSAFPIDQVSVRNLLGEVVLTPVTTGQYIQKIDLGELPSGVYFIKVNLRNSSEVVVKKVVKR